MSESLGKYEVIRVLGKGAMGTVYEGHDPVITRRVAIKTVRLPEPEDVEAREALARFKREAQAAGGLSHPNIVGIYDYGETADIAYIVMEMVDGLTLKQVLDRGERFELPAIVRLMQGLLRGLQYSHERGVIHRDIKPSNIMLTKNGDVKIADFGIARIESSSMTQAGTLMGTPSYMSPEQFMGQPVDSRIDIYASGVMLYQLLTGERPFEGGLTALMHKVLNTEPPPPSALSVTVPRGFDEVVKRAMAKRPGDRFATAAAFEAALGQAFDNRFVSQTAAAPPPEAADSDATMVAPSRAAPPPSASTPSASTPSASTPSASTSSASRSSASTRSASTRSAPAAAPAMPMAVPAASALPVINEPARKKGPPVALIGGGGALLVVAGAAAFLLLKPAPPAPALPAVPVAAVAKPAPPLMSAAERESTLTATLASLPCTLLSGQDAGANPVITGLAGAGAAQESLANALASLPAGLSPTANVTTLDGPYCDEIDAIRPYHPLFEDPSQALGLSLAGGKTTLTNGDLITVRNKLPGYGAYLETDYFSSDGSVLHLYPTPTDAQKYFAAHAVKMLGDAANGGASWQVSAPFGTDMIIAIASSAPLFASPRPQDENASDYLPALRMALQNVASAGGNVSVAAIPVVTQAK